MNFDILILTLVFDTLRETYFHSISHQAEQQTVMLLNRSPTVSKRYPPIPLEALEHEVQKRSADEGKLFREEFNVSPYLIL